MNYHVLGSSSSFKQKVAKSVGFVKDHENSSIWPTLATFRANYHVLRSSYVRYSGCSRVGVGRAVTRVDVSIAFDEICAVVVLNKNSVLGF